MQEHPVKLRGRDKLSKIAIQVLGQPNAPKPDWFKRSFTKSEIEAANALRATLRERKLVTVCEEARCPNLIECFGKHGTATFMILGDVCTRRCTFCDVAHGKPRPVDPMEAQYLCDAVKLMGLDYVVITSVDRDDLRDGGAGHFVNCISTIRQQLPSVKIEILVPDFRGRWPVALEKISQNPPDVFNHNIETVPRLYKFVRPGADYQHSLNVLQSFKECHSNVPTKSGLMLGLGEEDSEVEELLYDLRSHNVDRVTIGQYLSPGESYAPVFRYVHPDVFLHYKNLCYKMGFKDVQSAPLVRSSYHAKYGHQKGVL